MTEHREKKTVVVKQSHEEHITSIISRQTDGIQFPVNLDATFDTMFSNQGLKGIIEFILSNQDKFAI